MTRCSLPLSLCACLALWIAGASALAQPAPASPNVAAAQSLFAKANTAYNLGRFTEAAELFSKAYEEWPQPEFLYNIAQAYRLGGNCKLALHFYKRFRSLAEQNAAAPLGQKKRDDLEKFIAELTECVAKTDHSASTQPDGVVKPPNAPSPGSPGEPPKAATEPSTPPTPNGARGGVGAVAATAATREPPDAAPQLVVARLTGGIALLSAADLSIPAQPVVRLIAGYPIHVAPVTLEIGASVSYTPLPYRVMNATKRGTMLGMRAAAVASVPVASRIALRGELGLGMVSLSGLEAGNPLSSDTRAATFTLPSVAVGIAADFSLATNLTATLSPFNLTFSRGADGMYASSLREIDIVVGIGYRQ
jgi:hypothetical protein